MLGLIGGEVLGKEMKGKIREVGYWRRDGQGREKSTICKSTICPVKKDWKISYILCFCIGTECGGWCLGK